MTVLPNLADPPLQLGIVMGKGPTFLFFFHHPFRGPKQARKDLGHKVGARYCFSPALVHRSLASSHQTERQSGHNVV